MTAFQGLPSIAPLGWCQTEFASERTCTRWATQRVQIGCEHEHVGTVALCDHCTRVALLGGAWCGPCTRLSDDSHRCKLLGRLLPADDRVPNSTREESHAGK